MHIVCLKVYPLKFQLLSVTMKHFLPYIFLVGLSFISTKLVGQISIDYPSDRAIFQRDKNNTATIYISGSYTKLTDRIEAKLNAMNGGETIDWKPIKIAPQGGFYSGSLEARGGWYNLEVRAWRGDQIVATSQVAHVGVGEVFLVAGQSNGQGYQDYGAPGAQDDRVSCIDYNSTDLNTKQDFPYPQFTHLNDNSNISPRGKSAWCWGKLGDMLAGKLGVPILFYNVAWYGSAVRNWVQSINGTAYSVYVAGLPYEPDGMPYGNLRSVIQRYTPITGLRGVLWLQGEAEVQAGTNTEAYYNDLKTVIETGRNESGKNISWMVSLTSWNNRNGVNKPVIEGQQKVINSVPNVFTGPNTDLIQVPRNGGEYGVHFDGQGLIQLAEAWNNQLNDDFFSRSEPFKSISPVQVTAVCAGNGTIRLNAEGNGYNSFRWSTGETSGSIQVGNGTYSVSARDNLGNYVFSPDIRINEAVLPNRPSITLEGSNPICQGNSATLISSISENIQWNTGSTSDRLVVSSAGEYYVKTTNAYGCEATSEKLAISIRTSPLPDKPTVTAIGKVVFCEGGEVSLQSNSAVSNVWSNGANTSSIVVKSSGEYSVKAVDALGCYSPSSNPVVVKVNPLPQKPAVSINGPLTFCEGGNVVLTSSYDSGNIWSNSAISKSITVAATGIFTLKQRDANECESVSDPVSVTVNPLPATPVITALRPTTFCQRDYTILQSSEVYSYVWSNGETGRQIEIRNSGSFSIAAKDQNGCVSPASTPVQVVANPLPPTPTITADGATVFCANLSVNLQSSASAGYLWSNGATSQVLKVTGAGTYYVQTINEFQCFSDKSNTITTETLPLPPTPVVKALGSTTFCDGGFVSLQASDGNAFYWNTGAEGSVIQATASGDYSARTKDEKGCFSSYSSEIAVDVKPTPTTPVIQKTGVYTLSAENNVNAGDYNWKLNGTTLNETGGTLKAVQSGSYTVNNTIVYSPSLTCYSEYSLPFAFILDSSAPGFVAYPNPTLDGQVKVEILKDISNAEVQITDSHGVTHKSFRVNKFDRQQSFSVSGLPSGIYVIRIISASYNGNQKLIIVQ